MDTTGITNTGVLVALLLFAASMVSGAPANIGVAKDLEELKMAAEAEQQELSCLLNSNITKRAEVYSTVRNKHGFPDSPGTYIHCSSS